MGCGCGGKKNNNNRANANQFRANLQSARRPSPIQPQQNLQLKPQVAPSTNVDRRRIQKMQQEAIRRSLNK